MRKSWTVTYYAMGAARAGATVAAAARMRIAVGRKRPDKPMGTSLLVSAESRTVDDVRWPERDGSEEAWKNGGEQRQLVRSRER